MTLLLALLALLHNVSSSVLLRMEPPMFSSLQMAVLLGVPSQGNKLSTSLSKYLPSFFELKIKELTRDYSKGVISPTEKVLYVS